MDADAVEIRVLGCLIEKQRTTPDVYPLSLNALRLACNQATNRDPVVDYDEAVIREALQRLWRREWARLASGQGSRTVKYRHLLGETLGLAPDQLSVLAVLMLRGAQTPGELKQRTERLHAFAALDDVERTLEDLIARELVVRLERRPGQKEERYAQLLGGEDAAVALGAAAADGGARSVSPPGPRLEERVAALEAEVAALRTALEELAGPIDAVPFSTAPIETAPVGLGRFELPDERRDPLHGTLEIRERCRVGDADVVRGVAAERAARQDGDARLVEQPLCELVRRYRQRAHVREGVERASRLDAGHARDLVQGGDQVVAPPPELGHHLGDRFLCPLEGGHARELHERRHARGRVDDQPCERVDQRLGTAA